MSLYDITTSSTHCFQTGDPHIVIRRYNGPQDVLYDSPVVHAHQVYTYVRMYVRTYVATQLHTLSENTVGSPK